jgi:hypothetical protein
MRMGWAEHVAHMGDEQNDFRILVRKSEGKRPLGKHRRRCENDIKIDHREIG